MADKNAFDFQHQFASSGSGASRPSKDFKRSYQACLSCRRTKAKCEVPKGDNACKKCQRENRECVFTAERSVLKKGTTEDLLNGHDFPHKRPRTSRNRSSAAINNEGIEVSSSQMSHSLDHLGQHRHPRTVTRSEGSFQAERGEQKEQRIDREVMQTVVSSSNDALGLLFRAAEQQEQTDEAGELPNTSHVPLEENTPGSAGTLNVANAPVRLSALPPVSEDVIRIWEAFRFVKMGWFSAREAVAYIDLFFQNLFPLTPILTPYFSNHQNHALLISREPLLCCTLLLISSRYHVLPSPGGVSRAQHIHSRLWKHCEHLVQRITFGQEKYSLAKTRTLGSIEALLLITEWNPRALHFPPVEDGWDASLAPSLEDLTGRPLVNEDANLRKWREEVFEPAKRSDWMSWMLLGLATTLAHELGVFESPEASSTNEEMDFCRLRMRRLLFIYVNQLASRLGCTSLLPQSAFQSNLDITENATQFNGQHSHSEKLTTLWIDITKLLKTAADMFFPSRAFTSQLLESGRYIALLQHFQPLLIQWKEKFDSFDGSYIPSTSRLILSMEYQYVRMYINSLAIQALVERANARSTSEMELDLEILRLEHRQDYMFTQEVSEASAEILQNAVQLADEGNLALAPVRVFLRVASASIFLLKAISLGARKAELDKYLGILDQCINALRSKTLDDIHLSARYATLIERLVKRFRRNFRVHPQSNGAALPNTLAQTQFGESAPETQTTASSLPKFSGPISTQPATLGNLSFDDWLSQPFNPSIAPFGLGSAQTASGFEVDSLDFLWNLEGCSSTEWQN